MGKLALMPGDKVQLQEAPAVVTSSRSDDILAPLTDEDLTVQPKGLGDTGIFGLVGIGEVNPADKLHITSGTRAGIKLTKTGTLAGTVNFYNDGAFNINTPAAGFYVRSNNGNGDMHFYVRDFYFRDSGNNVFAKISNSSNLLALYDPVAPTDAKFRVEKDGDVRADGTVYAADFSTGSADVAERINTSEWVEAGNVVEIDPEHPGFFRKSTLPYSTKVAGIISTSPGVILGNSFDEATDEWEDNRPVLAVTGRVPCKVTTESGPIAIGDLLVASSTPGLAMKGNPEQATGAVVGKAIEPLEEGTREIMVQVTLR